MVSEAKSYMMLSNHNNSQFNIGTILELVCINLSIYPLQSSRDLDQEHTTCTLLSLFQHEMPCFPTPITVS